MREMLKKNKWITLLASLGVVYFFMTYIAPLLTPILLAFLFVKLLNIYQASRIYKLFIINTYNDI